MSRGRFITFEGGEASGKSTQLERLATRLRQAGIAVDTTREPGGTPIGEDVRALILKDRPENPLTELLLFAAARAEHMTAVIRPALDAGRWVISDRFMDSTRAYQGELFGVDPELISALERHTIGDDVPALTIILDVPADMACQRAEARGALTRFDAARLETHAALRQAFLDIAACEPDRCRVVDGARSEADVETAVWQAVTARLLTGVS